jgi:hypothetical protein
LNNDYKFKILIGTIDDQHKDENLHIDDIYTKGWDFTGPWIDIAHQVRKDLEDTGAMKDKI